MAVYRLFKAFFYSTPKSGKTDEPEGQKTARKMPIFNNAYAVAYSVAYSFFGQKTGVSEGVLLFFEV